MQCRHQQTYQKLCQHCIVYTGGIHQAQNNLHHICMYHTIFLTLYPRKN